MKRKHLWRVTLAVAVQIAYPATIKANTTTDSQGAAAPRAVNTLPLVSTDAPPALSWRWRRFSTADYVITAAGGAVTLTAAILKPRWTKFLRNGNEFDETVRAALRADSLQERYLYRDASDIGLSLSVSWPLVADAVVGAWWYRGSREAAQEMMLIDLQTFAVVGALQGAANVIAGRERPYGRDCGGEQLPSDSIDCTGSIRYRSFFSGHASFAFAGAALVCGQHFKTRLLGTAWDALSCGGAYAVATTTALFRNVSDVHYATDTLLGAAVGTLVGYGVPLLHYRDADHQSKSTLTELRVVPAAGGIGVLGMF